MIKEYDLKLTLRKSDIRKLRMGDIVYYSGVIHTLRDMGHRRVVNMAEQGKISEIPFQGLIGGALWHCGPIAEYIEDKNMWVVKSAGSTTSSRFSPLGAKMIEYLGIRITVGKGTMTKVAHEAMKKVGSCFLNTTGGCAAMYAEQIEAVENVYWTELGLPEACWVLKVNRLGPLIVGIDSCGNSLYDEMSETMRNNLEEAYVKYDLKDKYAYLPKRVPSGLI
ncbi:MAG: FumA C-terminus/TtdB family hydratase beta subunit [Eubacteriales bacterium]|nr:FumA C-terminus/TtdB family hydratase beta subunit [Eubacteriales bacterium]